jgi:acetylornithine deacetylase
MDTVGTAGMPAPFTPAVRDGRVYGRGAYDMKGSVAAVLAALVALAARPLSGRVVAALVADEEHASLGARAFLQDHSADACILTEPSEEQLILAHKGFAWFEATFGGRAAHGSRYELGASAIEPAASFVTAAACFDREVLRGRIHPLVGSASQHVATIEGGTGWSTYADSCTVRLERRTIPGEDEESVRREIEELALATGSLHRFESRMVRPAWVCDREAPIARATRRAMERLSGAPPRETGVAYWMDAALFAEAGIQTVNVGPAGGGAHETVEWVEMDSVVRTADILVETAEEFLGGESGATTP